MWQEVVGVSQGVSSGDMVGTTFSIESGFSIHPRKTTASIQPIGSWLILTAKSQFWLRVSSSEAESYPGLSLPWLRH